MGFVEDTAWKWRCKVLPNREIPRRTIADIEASLSKNDPKNVETKNADLGADATIITLYEGNRTVPGTYEWVSHPPKQMSKKAAQIQNRPAIKLFKIKDLKKPVIGGKFSLAYHQIAIQSPVLVAALEPILRKENWFLDLSDIAFISAPFRPLFFQYEEIVRLYRDTEDASLKAYVQLLVQALDQILGETRDKTRGLQANGLISFELAWTLFSNGTVVYSSGCNTEMLSKVDSVCYTETKNGVKVMRLNCEVLSFNGEFFDWVEQQFYIPHFSGNKRITDLGHYPLQFHADGDQIKERLIARGKTVLDFQGLKYCHYDGIALGSEGKHNVEGRILVDVVGYRRYELTKGKREIDNPENQRNRATPIHNASPPTIVEQAIDTSQKDGGVQKHLSEEQQLHNKEQMLARPDDLGFLAPTIEGYALKNKLWLLFYVEDISPIVWNNEAYDHLVYNDEQKDLVLSFVENHGTSKQHQVEDVILGKGQGLIILLSGPPGTGKTLTAEAVADRTRRPLFYLQAEDLGINAACLGAKLKLVFEMATDWDAVILLDEADVFMSQRRPHDIIRNELVSIFLRELEYFRGIIFLTTNLYETIDGAFRSRVSLHLRFSPLKQEARMQIWRKFLGRLPQQQAGECQRGTLSEDDIKDLSLWRLNGREIKNAVKMVTGWCAHKGHEMNLTRMEAGIRATTPEATKSGHPKDDDVLYDSRNDGLDIGAAIFGRPDFVPSSTNHRCFSLFTESRNNTRFARPTRYSIAILTLRSSALVVMDAGSEPKPRRGGARKPSRSPAGAPATRRFRSASQAEAARTSNACRICRDKKVKCSGQQPCKYCAKRGLDCVLAASEKRKLYSISQIRELEDKVAFYERRSREKSAPAAASPGWRMSPGAVTETAAQEPTQDDSCISVSLLSPAVGLDEPVSESTFSPVFERARAVEIPPAPTSSHAGVTRAIAPESALSSSETFGSEIKTLLISRSNPGSAASPATNIDATPLTRVDRRGLLEALGPWPTEEEAHAMLDIVVFNVGISQQLFDVRAFSDSLSLLYRESAADVKLPEMWIVEALLVFAVGRLLQGRDDESGDLPGTGFFCEAVKRTPLLGELRRHGVMGVEVVALTALYLQIVDRKDDAYLHSNTALRLAISHGLHRASVGINSRRSEAVHRNRLWWSIYMQERRLCAAGGYPMSIEDYAITTDAPYEVPGFSSATALAVNVKAARITGKITSTIYSQKHDPESTFINNVQGILHSLYEVEKTMPLEYSMEIKPSGLLVAGRPFMDAPTTTSRTSSSLYISVYSAVIHTVRPILLYMARNSRDPEREGSRAQVSPALVRLAEICVETAGKSLVILQELRKREILAKNAFLDLDATFSVGYIFVLVEAINPGKSLGFKGIDGSRAILRYVVGLGNRAAGSRLAELDQMCMHLALPVRHGTGLTPQQSLTDLLTKPFSFESGYRAIEEACTTLDAAADTLSRPGAGSGGREVCDNEDPGFEFSGADLASIPLEGENSLYWVYHTPGFSFTGVEQTDWEALENQIPWGNQP